MEDVSLLEQEVPCKTVTRHDTKENMMKQKSPPLSHRQNLSYEGQALSWVQRLQRFFDATTAVLSPENKKTVSRLSILEKTYLPFRCCWLPPQRATCAGIFKELSNALNFM